MIRGVCTDRGTEFGLVDAEGGNDVSYAAPWIQRSRSLYADGYVPVQQNKRLLMPNAVASAGVCHCFDNLEKDMDRQLSLWVRWIIGFKALCSLFCKVHLLEFFRIAYVFVFNIVVSHFALHINNKKLSALRLNNSIK